MREIDKKTISSDSKRHEAGKLCKAFQILARSSPSFISDFVRTQSGSQDMNILPSAPKTPGRIRLELSLIATPMFLGAELLLLCTNY